MCQITAEKTVGANYHTLGCPEPLYSWPILGERLGIETERPGVGMDSQ